VHLPQSFLFVLYKSAFPDFCCFRVYRQFYRHCPFPNLLLKNQRWSVKTPFRTRSDFFPKGLSLLGAIISARKVFMARPPFKKSNSRPFSSKPGSASRGSAGSSRPQQGPSSGKGVSQRTELSLRTFEKKNQRVITGHHAIREFLEVRPRELVEFWVRQGWESNQDLRSLVEIVRRRGVSVEEKPESMLDKLSASHQGAAVIARALPEVEWSQFFSKESAVIVALDGLEDPHNLGAILRTAWLMGVDALLVPQDRAVGLTPSAHKVASGGAEHVPVIEVPAMNQVFDQFKEHGFWIFGLAGESKKELFELEIPEKIIWVVGAEDKGMRSTTSKACDELISIPQVNSAASYNASVATGMALAETLRQQKTKKN
jgi:23S rRNA (guanosine2251-2'-O)-methyltransferase